MSPGSEIFSPQTKRQVKYLERKERMPVDLSGRPEVKVEEVKWLVCLSGWCVFWQKFWRFWSYFQFIDDAVLSYSKSPD